MTPFEDIDFRQPVVFLLASALLFVIVYVRYLAISGIYHYVFFVLLRKRYARQVFKQPTLRRRQVGRELGWAFLGALVFAVAGVGMVALWQDGRTAIYTSTYAYPWWYLPISVVLALLVHDTYYYWVHRWMHVPKVFRLMHKTHHDSVHTSVFTAFSFHPIESVLQAVIVPLIVIFLPLHIYAVLFLLVFMTISATINHAGVEVYPKGWRRHWLAKWLIGATHHDHHHRKFSYNYGLYFSFWDVWMGTEYDGKPPQGKGKKTPAKP